MDAVSEQTGAIHHVGLVLPFSAKNETAREVVTVRVYLASMDPDA